MMACRMSAVAGPSCADSSREHFSSSRVRFRAAKVSLSRRATDRFTPGYDFVAAGSEQAAKAAGKMRLEGRDYIVQDGDVMLFRFNV